MPSKNVRLNKHISGTTLSEIVKPRFPSRPAEWDVITTSTVNDECGRRGLIARNSAVPLYDTLLESSD